MMRRKDSGFAENETIHTEPPHPPTPSTLSKSTSSVSVGTKDMFRTVSRWFRPPIKEGFTRLEWYNQHGDSFWDDFKCHESELNDLATRIQQQGYVVTTTMPTFTTTASHYTPPWASTTAPPSYPSTPTTQTTAPGSSSLSSVPSLGQAVYLYLCINTSSTETKLGEIIIVDRNGQTLIATDKELFTAIRQKYNSMRRRHLFAWMCIANDIHYVKFEIHRQLVGILEKPDSVPPPAEVQLGRYSHSPPPMTAMRFYNHYNEHENLSNAYERFWLDVLPTKLGTSIPTDDSQREFGWAIHIIERPRLNVIAMTALICVLLDVGVAVIYCTCTDDKDRGWTIASWIARIQTLILSSLYFHYQNM
jgi:hypothetical protein